MAGSLEQPALHVEGHDDLHSLVHLLIRHGVDYDTKPWPPTFPRFIAAGDINKLTQSIPVAVPVANGKTVGFVLDADVPLARRWTAVRKLLSSVDVPSPTTPVRSGFIGRSDRFNARVGVWLMPDNQRDGALEDFLYTLIQKQDALIGHASSSTDIAMGLGAAFSPNDKTKAVIHTWLAWQKDPGRPYGKAISFKYFEHDSETANAFVAWFRELYSIK